MTEEGLSCRLEVELMCSLAEGLMMIVVEGGPM